MDRIIQIIKDGKTTLPEILKKTRENKSKFETSKQLFEMHLDEFEIERFDCTKGSRTGAPISFVGTITKNSFSANIMSSAKPGDLDYDCVLLIDGTVNGLAEYSC